MSGTIVVPVIKSPHSMGRIGPETWQDWHRGIMKAISIAWTKHGQEVLVLSNARYSGQPHEADLYCHVLSKFGAAGINVRVIREGYETVEQIKRTFELAVAEKKELVFVSTFFHFPRVQWLIWRYKTKVPAMRVRHCVAFGIPRPREILTDIILIFLFPLIDICGGRQWFVRTVNKRRVGGKL